MHCSFGGTEKSGSLAGLSSVLVTAALHRSPRLLGSNRESTELGVLGVLPVLG